MTFSAPVAFDVQNIIDDQSVVHVLLHVLLIPGAGDGDHPTDVLGALVAVLDNIVTSTDIVECSLDDADISLGAS